MYRTKLKKLAKPSHQVEACQLSSVPLLSSMFHISLKRKKTRYYRLCNEAEGLKLVKIEILSFLHPYL